MTDLQWGPAQDDGTVLCVPPQTADPADREPFPEVPIYVTPPEECPDFILVEPLPGDVVITLPVEPDEPEPVPTPPVEPIREPEATVEIQLPLPEPYLPDELAYTGPEVWLGLVVAVMFIFTGFSVMLNARKKRITDSEGEQ